ncbi:extracellular solute-binding protein [Paenibacillus nasutitermitis]|uniref:ABC transporter n=1 Tax=Paenibacillus nasutitermitis TaxID=1652958 RepID=A0A916YJJ3_9BACL|nr:extracellular solute-binding protein [Paenibacillus nasutitermitis]GGD47747.1 ABC transporter [Paenibacillus nasutitermitis]
MRTKWTKWITIPVLAGLLLTGCTSNNNNSGNSGSSEADKAGKPETWIADRTITGLLFIDSDDVSKDINPEIAKVIKERTGITLQLEAVNSSRAVDGMIAGFASGDLPDFIVSYLDHSARPEMPVLVKAAKEGVLTDLTPLMKNTKVYSNYLKDDYLPLDSKNGIMFRPDLNGSSYFVHMRITKGEQHESLKFFGGPFIRKDIAEALQIDPRTITSTEQVYELAKKIKEGNFKDNNGKAVIPIGPQYWGNGNHEVGTLFRDITWGSPDQKFYKNQEGKIIHESNTDYMMKRIELVQKMLDEKLMAADNYTMEGNRATEGAINGSFAIISEMHNNLDFNKDMHYLPLGPIDRVDGPYQMVRTYKEGSFVWSIPSTTKKPQEVMDFADFLASREGKLLWQYGLEGRDYTLDDKGNPLVKQEVLDLKAKDPEAAKELGFEGAGNNWGQYLGWTDANRFEDFGEAEYGESVLPSAYDAQNKIADYWSYDEKKKNALIVDGYRPLSFINESASGTDLQTALDNYSDSMIRAFYAKSMDKAKSIMDSAKKQLQAAGLQQYEELLNQKNSDPSTPIITQ